MKSSSLPESRPRQGRTLVLTLVLSLALHLLFLAFGASSQQLAALLKLPRPRPTHTPQLVTTSQAITIERRAHPVPHAPPHRAQPPPQPRVVPVPAQPPPVALRRPVVAPTLAPPEAIKREIAKPVPHKPLRASPAPRAVAQVQPRPVESEAPPAPAGPHQRSRLSTQQLAQLNQDFSQTIEQSRSMTNPLRVPPATPAAPKRYAMQFQGMFGTLKGGEGTYTPTAVRWRDHGLDCYYVSYEFMYDDGLGESGSVPWPACFPPGGDPFYQPPSQWHRYPLPLPPPGWRLPAGHTLAKALRLYLESNHYAEGG